ncbi:MAG: hypothetical protein ACRDX9_01395 [Acidimicrobiia bacterium]
MRALGVVLGVLVALVSALTAVAADQETWYLASDDFPHGSLLLNPESGELTNFDPGRDIKPGLMLERSDLGLAEQDGARYQHWQVEAGGGRLAGYPRIVIWGSADLFAPDTTGVFDVFILDCDSSGSACVEVASETVTMESGRGINWIETTVDFDAVDHVFEERRHLGVRIVVSDSSEADMIFAYGNTTQRSRLTLYAEPPTPIPVETTIATEPAPVDDAVVPFEPVVAEDISPPVEAAADVASMGPWLITLAMSTVALAAFGSLLISSLSKSGRHERVPVSGQVSGDDQARRISVSAP